MSAAYDDFKRFLDGEIADRVKQVREIMHLRADEICPILGITEDEMTARDVGEVPWSATELNLFSATTATDLRIYHDEDEWKDFLRLRQLLLSDENTSRSPTVITFSPEFEAEIERRNRKERLRLLSDDTQNRDG